MGEDPGGHVAGAGRGVEVLKAADSPFDKLRAFSLPKALSKAIGRIEGLRAFRDWRIADGLALRIADNLA